MADWKTAPVYPGVKLKFGDRYYEPGTRSTGIFYSTDLMSAEDIDRIYKQLGSSAYYLIRPYSQSSQKPNATKPQVTKNSKVSTTGKPRTSASSTTGKSRTALAPKTPASNSWINKGIHVGNNGVTYTNKQGNTTDVTNSHNLSEIILGSNSTSEPTVNTQFLEQTASNLISPNQSHFGRKGTKDFMRQNLVNPEDYSTSERRAFRHSINNDKGDWSGANRIMSDARINNKLGQATGLNNYQLQKPQLNMPNQLNNNLVSLKFKQGGQMYKYQQGGRMQQANGQGIEKQAIALVQAAMQGDQQASQTIQQIMQAAQQGDQQAVQVAQLLQAVIQKMQGSRKARLGAKLNYFKQTDECPEGQELVYFKKGGEICKVCQGKKMQNGGKSNPVSDFRKKREQEQLKKNYQRNPATRGKSAKEIAEMQKRNRQEASQGKGEAPANVAPWQYKKK